MIWFTSDTHFGHANIIRYCNRPFASVNEMNERMVYEWNLRVQPDDTVHHVGDFAFGRDGEETTRRILPRLNGKIHLTRGNHDIFDTYGLFASVDKSREIIVDGQEITLYHYAQRTWHHDLRGAWHLFGHSHSALHGHGKSFDIGVDCWRFRPVSFDEVKRKMDKLEIPKTTPRFRCRDCKQFPCICEDHLGIR